jgi:hypothetical protein
MFYFVPSLRRGLDFNLDGDFIAIMVAIFHDYPFTLVIYNQKWIITTQLCKIRSSIALLTELKN